jgi:hypothetical protein
VRVSDKGLGKTEEKLSGWGKLSTTKDPRARKYKSLYANKAHDPFSFFFFPIRRGGVSFLFLGV